MIYYYLKPQHSYASNNGKKDVISNYTGSTQPTVQRNQNTVTENLNVSPIENQAPNMSQTHDTQLNEFLQQMPEFMVDGTLPINTGENNIRQLMNVNESFIRRQRSDIAEFINRNNSRFEEIFNNLNDYRAQGDFFNRLLESTQNIEGLLTQAAINSNMSTQPSYFNLFTILLIGVCGIFFFFAYRNHNASIERLNEIARLNTLHLQTLTSQNKELVENIREMQRTRNRGSLENASALTLITLLFGRVFWRK